MLRRRTISGVLGMALALPFAAAGCGGSGGVTAASAPHFKDTVTFYKYLDAELELQCSKVAHVVPPEKVAHPKDSGETVADAVATGQSAEGWDMSNRIQESGGCVAGPTPQSPTLIIAKFDGTGLGLEKYVANLKSAILPSGCDFGEAMNDGEPPTLIEVVRSDQGSLWNIEASSVTSEETVPDPLEKRRAQAEKIADLVDGTVVEFTC